MFSKLNSYKGKNVFKKVGNNLQKVVWKLTNYEKQILDSIYLGKLTKKEVEKYIRSGGNIEIANVNNETLLYLAIKYCDKGNNKEIAMFLIQRGANINIVTTYDATPVFQALLSGELELTKLLLNNPGLESEKLNLQENFTKNTPLHIAAEKGYSDVVKNLIEQVVDLDSKNKDGKIFLDLIANERLKREIQIFMVNKCFIRMRLPEIIIKDYSFEKCFEKLDKFISTYIFKDFIDNIDEYCEVCADSIEKRTIWQDKSYNDLCYSEQVSVDMDNGILPQEEVLNPLWEIEFCFAKKSLLFIYFQNTNKTIKNFDKYMFDVFRFGAIPAHLAEYLAVNSKYEEIANKNDDTLLHWAVLTNNAVFLRLLIDKHSITIENVNGQTPLMLARERHNEEIIRILEEAEEKYRPQNSITEKQVPEIINAQKAKVNFAEIILELVQTKNLTLEQFKSFADDNIGYRNEDGSNLLHIAVYNQLDPDIINYLLAKLPINSRDYHGYTPLYHAVITKNVDNVRLLCQKKADMNYLYYEEQESLLQIATNYLEDKVSREIVFLLVEHGSKYNFFAMEKIRKFSENHYNTKEEETFYRRINELFNRRNDKENSLAISEANKKLIELSNNNELDNSYLQKYIENNNLLENEKLQILANSLVFNPLTTNKGDKKTEIDFKVAKTIINAGTDINGWIGKFRIIEMLLEGETSKKRVNLEAVKFLIDNKARINLINKKNNGYTPLIWAMTFPQNSNYAETIVSLLEWGAKPSIKDANGIDAYGHCKSEIINKIFSEYKLQESNIKTMTDKEKNIFFNRLRNIASETPETKIPYLDSYSDALFEDSYLKENSLKLIKKIPDEILIKRKKSRRDSVISDVELGDDGELDFVRGIFTQDDIDTRFEFFKYLDANILDIEMLFELAKYDLLSADVLEKYKAADQNFDFNVCDENKDTLLHYIIANMFGFLDELVKGRQRPLNDQKLILIEYVKTSLADILEYGFKPNIQNAKNETAYNLVKRLAIENSRLNPLANNLRDLILSQLRLNLSIEEREKQIKEDEQEDIYVLDSLKTEKSPDDIIRRYKEYLNKTLSDDASIIDGMRTQDEIDIMIQYADYVEENISNGEMIIKLAKYDLLNDERIKQYLDAGGDINIVDRDGQSLLHWAAKENNEKIVSYLIDKGLSGALQDINGNTPLHYAVMNYCKNYCPLNFRKIYLENGSVDFFESAKIVKMLYAEPADMQIENNDNKSPIDLVKGDLLARLKKDKVINRSDLADLFQFFKYDFASFFDSEVIVYPDISDEVSRRIGKKWKKIMISDHEEYDDYIAENKGLNKGDTIEMSVIDDVGLAGPGFSKYFDGLDENTANDGGEAQEFGNLKGLLNEKQLVFYDILKQAQSDFNKFDNLRIEADLEVNDVFDIAFDLYRRDSSEIRSVFDMFIGLLINDKVNNINVSRKISISNFIYYVKNNKYKYQPHLNDDRVKLKGQKEKLGKFIDAIGNVVLGTDYDFSKYDILNELIFQSGSLDDTKAILECFTNSELLLLLNKYNSYLELPQKIKELLPSINMRVLIAYQLASVGMPVAADLIKAADNYIKIFDFHDDEDNKTLNDVVPDGLTMLPDEKISLPRDILEKESKVAMSDLANKAAAQDVERTLGGGHTIETSEGDFGNTMNAAGKRTPEAAKTGDVFKTSAISPINGKNEAETDRSKRVFEKGNTDSFNGGKLLDEMFNSENKGINGIIAADISRATMMPPESIDKNYRETNKSIYKTMKILQCGSLGDIFQWYAKDGIEADDLLNSDFCGCLRMKLGRIINEQINKEEEFDNFVNDLKNMNAVLDGIPGFELYSFFDFGFLISAKEKEQVFDEYFKAKCKQNLSDQEEQLLIDVFNDIREAILKYNGDIDAISSSDYFEKHFCKYLIEQKQYENTINILLSNFDNNSKYSNVFSKILIQLRGNILNESTIKISKYLSSEQKINILNKKRMIEAIELYEPLNDESVQILRDMLTDDNCKVSKILISDFGSKYNEFIEIIKENTSVKKIVLSCNELSDIKEYAALLIKENISLAITLSSGKVLSAVLSDAVFSKSCDSLLLDKVYSSIDSFDLFVEKNYQKIISPLTFRIKNITRKEIRELYKKYKDLFVIEDNTENNNITNITFISKEIYYQRYERVINDVNIKKTIELKVLAKIYGKKNIKELTYWFDRYGVSYTTDDIKKVLKMNSDLQEFHAKKNDYEKILWLGQNITKIVSNKNQMFMEFYSFYDKISPELKMLFGNIYEVIALIRKMNGDGLDQEIKEKIKNDVAGHKSSASLRILLSVISNYHDDIGRVKVGASKSIPTKEEADKKNAKEKNRIKKKIDDFYETARAKLENYEIYFDRMSLILNENPDYFDNKVIINFCPHNDDNMWSYILSKQTILKKDKEKIALVAADYSGIDLFTAYLLILEQKKQDVSFVIESKSQMIKILSDIRRKELEEINIAVDSYNDENDDGYLKWFTPKKLYVDDSGRSFSYLTEYVMPTPQQIEKLKKYYRDMMINFMSKNKGKQLIIKLPFIYDKHPIHRRVAELILDVIAELPEGLREYVEPWMYFSGDVSGDFPLGNVTVFYNEKEAFDKSEAWNKYYRSQVSRYGSYQLANIMFDHENSNVYCALRPDGHGREKYAEKFLKVNLDVNQPGIIYKEEQFKIDHIISNLKQAKSKTKLSKGFNI